LNKDKRTSRKRFLK